MLFTDYVLKKFQEDIYSKSQRRQFPHHEVALDWRIMDYVRRFSLPTSYLLAVPIHCHTVRECDDFQDAEVTLDIPTRR